MGRDAHAPALSSAIGSSPGRCHICFEREATLAVRDQYGYLPVTVHVVPPSVVREM